MAPPINVLYTNAPVNLTPQNTWNYQVGTTYQTDAFTVSADGYYTDFSNRIASRTLAGGDTAFFNSGGAVYKGLEFEGTVRVHNGISLYGNYTLNSADLKGGGGPLSVTPRTTAAARVILHRPDTFREGDRSMARSSASSSARNTCRTRRPSSRSRPTASPTLPSAIRHPSRADARSTSASI